MPQPILARTYRYNRRLLFGAATTISIAILSIAFLAVSTVVDQYRAHQVALFVTERQQVKAETDNLSTRIMQFVDLYEGAWTLHQYDRVPLQKYQQLLMAENGISATARDLTVTPFTLVSDATVSRDGNALGTFLRILRDLSVAASIDARKVGVSFKGSIYAPGGQFAAYSPVLDAQMQARARQIGPARFNLAQSDFAERLLAGQFPQMLRTNRPYWVDDRQGEGRSASVSEIVVPIFDGDEHVLTIDVSVDFDNFLKLFLQNKRKTGFFVLDRARRHNLGYVPRTAAEKRRYYAVEQQAALIGRADGVLRTYRIGGVFYITQKIDGPGWLAVSVYDWHDMLVSLRREAIFALCIVVGSLFFLWGAAFYFDRRVAAPLRISIEKRIEAEHFSKSIIDTIPVGVSVYIPETNEVVLENAVAARMLGVNNGRNSPDLYNRFLDEGVSSSDVRTRHVFKEIEWMLDEERPAYIGVTASTIIYSGHTALLFGLIDLNFKKENERLLIAAKEKSDEANRAKSMFVALITHEIRTPLHGAIGHLELLEREVKDPEPAARISMIRRSVDSLLTLVGDLLDLTKIESNALTISTVRMCVNDVVEQCVQHFAPSMTQRQVRCLCITDPWLDRAVYGDDQRLTQILQNLLSNASKFTEEGTVSIRSRVIGDRLGSRLWVRLEISDTGIGIAAALQSTLFNALSQADNTISRRYGGTGLGLFLCRKLTEMMGGRITLESAPGVGSTFYVDLPFEPVSDDVDTDAENRPLPLPPIRVASDVVDPEWRSALSQRITEWGAIFIDTQEAAHSEDASIYSSTSNTSNCDVFIKIADMAASEARRNVIEPAIGTIYLAAGLPLVPRFERSNIFLTSLSRHALRETLRQLAGYASASSAEQRQPAVLPTKQAADLDILIVEDDAVSRILLCHQLRQLGFQRVRSAENGLAALALWRERPADLLITDLSMPALGGLELSQKIRDTSPDAKIVFTTASDKSKLEHLNLAFDGQLEKPVMLGALARVIEEVMGDHRGRVTSSDDSLDTILWAAFEKEWPKDRASLGAALDSGDYPLSERRIHRLQSAFLAIGNSVLIDDLTSLQDAVTVRDEKRIQEVWATLLTHAEALMHTRSPLPSIGT